MKNLLISVGEYQFFDEPSNKNGLIGGKIIANNPDTKEECFRTYKRYHTGKTDKYNVLAKLITELVPPEKKDEEDGIIEAKSEEE